MRHIITIIVERLRPAADQANSLREATFCSADGSYKVRDLNAPVEVALIGLLSLQIIKHTLSGTLAVCYTLLNERGEIRLQVLCPSKSLEHIREPINKMLASLKAHGLSLPQILWIDNIPGEAKFFRSLIPSLSEGVVPIPEQNLSGLPVATLPPPTSYPVDYFTTSTDIEDACRDLLRLHPLGADVYIGFDMEWVDLVYNHLGDADDRHLSRMALVQIATAARGYLFQVCQHTVPRPIVLLEIVQLSTLPSLPKSLVLLLAAPGFKKLGRNIKADFTRLAKDFPEAFTSILRPAGIVDIWDFARDRDVLAKDLRNPSLQTIVGAALGTYLEKVPDIRRGRWDLELAEEQQHYAMLDAYVALELYRKIKDRAVYNLPLTLTDPPGTAIYFRANRKVIAIGVTLPKPAAGSAEVDEAPAEADGKSSALQHGHFH